MKNFKELSDFVRSNGNWRELLMKPPYCMRSVSECPYHPGWYMIMYNLFRSDLSLPVVRQSRGTVVDDEGNVICAPYTKFFNHGEKYADDIDWGTAIVREKIDGQLIKMFRHDGESYWVTNGGWSPECLALSDGCPYKDGMELLKAAIGDDTWTSNVPDGTTIMFELTSPWNKIICDYTEPKLWLHGCRMASGDELTPEQAKDMYGIPYEIPRIIKGTSFEELTALMSTWNGHLQEGIVVCDSCFRRVKIKCDDYLKCKFEACLSSKKMLWRVWADGEWDDIRDLGIRQRISEFNDSTNGYIDAYKTLYDMAMQMKDSLDKYSVEGYTVFKKQYAMEVQTKFKDGFTKGLLFAAFDRTYDAFREGLMRSIMSSWKKYNQFKAYSETISENKRDTI